MKPSVACYTLVCNAEGTKLKAYRDSGGVWTCGTGHIKGVTSSTTCTPEQATAWLEADMADAAAAVNRLATPCTQNQFDALVSFAFNEGAGKLASSTLLYKHRAKDFAGAAGEFGKWIYCDHEVLPGLVKRRAAEAALYLGEAS